MPTSSPTAAAPRSRPRYGALSADHLEYTGSAGVRGAWRRPAPSRCCCPGAFYALRETRLPPVAELRRAGVPMAIATDCNPGSSPALSLLLMMNMACHLFRLTPEECLAGVTRCAARALGLESDRGTLEAGKRADLVTWDISEPAELTYWMGGNPMVSVVSGGKHHRPPAASTLDQVRSGRPRQAARPLHCKPDSIRRMIIR